MATGKELHHASSCCLSPCKFRNRRYKLRKGHEKTEQL